MNINRAKIYHEIAQCGSVSAASSVCMLHSRTSVRQSESGRGISDPALRADSEGNGSYQEGQQFIAQARRVIQESEGLNQIPGNKKGTDVEMKISIQSQLCILCIWKVLEGERCEELRLHIRECNSVQALDNLTKKHYNLALIGWKTNMKNITIPLFI